MDSLGTGLKPKYDFTEVDALVVEPPLSSRRVLRMALNGIGLRRLTEIETQVPDRGSVNLGAYDLIFLDAREDTPEVFRLIGEIRNRTASTNPFPVIIVTTFEPTQALIQRAFNAGVDDVLVKPVALKQVHDRIATLVEARRPFIVTATYMGPDRRKNPRPDSVEVPMVTVPNPLQSKTLRPEQRAEIGAQIDQTWRHMNRLRAIRCAHHAAFILQLVQSAPDGGYDLTYFHEIEKVPGVLADLTGRLESPNDRALAMALADAIVEPMREAENDAAALAPSLPGILERAIELIILCEGDGDPDRLRSTNAAVVQAFRRRMEQARQ
jgi:CheY-like chemotaxis protein